MDDMKFQLTITDYYGHTGRPTVTKTIEAPDLQTAQALAQSMAPGDLSSDQFITLDEVMALDETEFMPIQHGDRYYLTLGYLRKHNRLNWSPYLEAPGWQLGDEQGGWEWHVGIQLIDPTVENINRAADLPLDCDVSTEMQNHFGEHVPRWTEFEKWNNGRWDVSRDQYFDMIAAIRFLSDE